MAMRDLKAPLFYKISFCDPRDAKKAAEELDGSLLGGSTLQATFDDREWKKNSVTVQGIPRDVSEEEIRDHFALVGKTQDVKRFEDRLFGEVRFQDEDGAWRAKAKLDGSILYSHVLRVELDCMDPSLCKVLVHGINPGARWQELKDHFMQAGTVVYAAVHGGRTARIRFKRYAAAGDAVRRLRGSMLKGKGTRHKLQVAAPYNQHPDAAEVRVRGMPADATVDDLWQHFRECGDIAEITIQENEPLPPEFCESV